MSIGTSSALNSEQDLASIPMVGGGLSRLAIARLKSAGVEVAPLLKRAGLTPEAIAEPEERLSVRSQIALLEEAAIALKDDCIGFTLARDFDPREIGLLYYVMASSQTLGDALKRIARYSKITNEALVFGYQEGSRLVLSLSYSGVSRHSDRHQIEFCMFGALRLCRMLTGQNLVPQHFAISHYRSEGASEMARFVGTKVEFGADRDEFALNVDARELPLAYEGRERDLVGASAWKGARGRRCPQSGNEQEDACTKALGRRVELHRNTSATAARSGSSLPR